jgi:hypothetical protein
MSLINTMMNFTQETRKKERFYLYVYVPKKTKWRHHTSLLQHSSTRARRVSAYFLYFTQRIIVIPDRRFWTTYRSHLQGSSSARRSRFLKMGPICCPKCRHGIANLRSVKSQKSAYLMYTAVAEWNHLRDRMFYLNFNATFTWRLPFPQTDVNITGLKLLRCVQET